MRYESDLFILVSSKMVLVSIFLMLFGFVITTAIVDWYVANVLLPQMIDAKEMLDGLKIMGFAFAASVGVFGFLLSSCWLLVGVAYRGIEWICGWGIDHPITPGGERE